MSVSMAVCRQAHYTDHMREEHGAYWFVVERLAAGPQSLWGWKVYAKPGGRVSAMDRAASEDEAGQAARDWIACHQ
jgi:hypothetical protein